MGIGEAMPTNSPGKACGNDVGPTESHRCSHKKIFFGHQAVDEPKNKKLTCNFPRVRLGGISQKIEADRPRVVGRCGGPLCSVALCGNVIMGLRCRAHVDGVMIKLIMNWLTKGQNYSVLLYSRLEIVLSIY